MILTKPDEDLRSNIELESILSSISNSSDNNSGCVVTYRLPDKINSASILEPNESNLSKDKRVLSSIEIKNRMQ